jgi:hypothetical protein
MSSTNLFSRLAGYSQNPRKLSIENFCTELLAYFFNQDLIFRRRFLKVIFSDQRMARPFKWAEATTQGSLGQDCRVDLVLRAGSRYHLVEIKIAASETRSGRWGQRGKPQVQRYIDLALGNVTYLTTSESLAPDVDHRGRKFRMVKHALFEELYEALSAARVSALTKMFLEFMEENDMAKPQPFDRKELRDAEEALNNILVKCQHTLEIVRTEANTEFRRNLRTRSNLTRATLNIGPDWAYVHCYLPKFSPGAVKWVGLSLSAEDGGIYFAVWMWGTLDRSITKIRDHLDWEKWDDDEHSCRSSMRLHGNSNDVPRMVKFTIAASRDLGRAIRKYA